MSTFEAWNSVQISILKGILTDENDRCFSLRGYAIPDEKQQSVAILTNFDVLDSGADHNFKIDNVIMKLDIDPVTTHRRMILEHPQLKFITEKWHRGYRADVEIREHINPAIVGYGRDLFIGNMTINIISTRNFVPLKRRLSLANDNVIEMSNDFLA
ncbi:unnamed protein product [Litomosoides sigmodontis]|uniref:Uncharacterized protein n=1 Tax=Litomosoides sigmodontis TaxID=42156 RepID=A0A3P6TWG3_LITSI|nr:unnamed protein product [Litomosoides sigmodontis]